VRVKANAEQPPGVSIEYLRPDDHGQGMVSVDPFGTEDQAQERLPREG